MSMKEFLSFPVRQCFIDKDLLQAINVKLETYIMSNNTRGLLYNPGGEGGFKNAILTYWTRAVGSPRYKQGGEGALKMLF